MAQQNDLVGAIRKLALAGERAGFTVEEMIGLQPYLFRHTVQWLLPTGENLLDIRSLEN